MLDMNGLLMKRVRGTKPKFVNLKEFHVNRAGDNWWCISRVDAESFLRGLNDLGDIVLWSTCTYFNMKAAMRCSFSTTWAEEGFFKGMDSNFLGDCT